MKNLILLTVLSFTAPVLHAQEVSIEVDRNTILIGEQIGLQLRAEFQKGQKLSWFSFDSIPHFEIMQRSPVDTQVAGETTSLIQNMIITSWDSGRWTIPPLLLNRAKTSPVSIDVTYTEMDPNRPYHDIKDIIAVKSPQQSKWYWYFIFGAVLLGLFLLFFPSLKKNSPAATAVAEEDAYEAAMKKLLRLQSGKNMDDKDFFTEVVQVFREYVYRRKNIQSFSKTTDDLSLQLKNLDLPAPSYSDLVQSLQLSDMVKFAKYKPGPEEKMAFLETVAKNIEAIEKLSNAV